MKDNTNILTLQDIEELCRLYLDCQLSVLEEKELEYVLLNTSYSSLVIDEAKESMMAESLLSLKDLKRSPRNKAKFTWVKNLSGIAASLTIIFLFSIFIGNKLGNDEAYLAEKHSLYTPADQVDEVFIAYEGGKRLDPKDAEEAVSESLKKAEYLMALATAKEKEMELKQEYLISLMTE